MRKTAVLVVVLCACGRSTPPTPSVASSSASSSPPASASSASLAPPSAQPSSAPPRPSLSAAALDEIDWRVTGGFDSKDRIVDLVSRRAGAPRDAVKEEVEKQLAAHAEKQATWKGRTDVEKIEAVFASLEKDGILARPNFHATQDEANEEIEEEVKRRKAAGKPVRGWVYFTDENTRMAVREGTLMLIYGAPGTTDAARYAIATTVERRLKAAGLAAEWPYENSAYPVAVNGLTWRKRRLSD